MWLEDLGLNTTDKWVISGSHELSDKIINAAQRLLQITQNIDGLQDTLLCQLDAFQPSTSPSVQIHFDEDRKHWATSSSTRGRVEFADSLNKGKLSQSIVHQLQQCYASLAVNGKLTVYVLPVQQQSNSIDCGCHAIATATEFLADDGNPTSEFNIDSLRKHIIHLFETEIMEIFPKSAKNAEVVKEK